MEPLYTTQTAYTFDEYKKYNKRILLNKLLLIFILFIAVITLLFILSKSSIFLILMLLYIIILAVVLPILINWNLKKVFYADKHLQKNGLYTYSFYENYFEAKTNSSFTKFDYEDIFSIIESKTNFYIMKSPNQAHIIVKNNCSPELLEFISNLKNKK